MKKLAQYKKYIPLGLFVLFMLGYTIFNLITPSIEFSEMENRPLAQLPKPTVDSVISNEFSTKFEIYVSDQFALRNRWISSKSMFESMLGKEENNGILYGADDYLFDKTLSINDEQFERNLGYVSQFSGLEQVKGKNLYFTLVPSSSYILAEKLPAHIPLPHEGLYLDAASRHFFDTPFTVVNMENSLQEQKDQYIYYRTDHHWTSFGAYFGYVEFMREKGLEPVPMQTLLAENVPDFYGTYYNKAKKIGTVPDTITWYDIPVVSLTIGEEKYHSMYDLAQFEKRDKYAAFLHSNNGVTLIKSTNPTVAKGSSIMVFKDSYGNSFVPYLANHYETIVVVDTRYLPSILPILEEHPVDDYYVIYSFHNFTQEDNIAKLTGLL